MVWSVATLLSAVTHNYDELLLRHLIVGIGEATFVVIAPAFLADLFPETIRGRVMGLFYLSLPVGSAFGYVVGGILGHHYGGACRFWSARFRGCCWRLGCSLVREPERGASDHLPNTVERGTILGLFRNKAYWTVSLGMAMMTFAVGGLQVWMPTFLTRSARCPAGHGQPRVWRNDGDCREPWRRCSAAGWEIACCAARPRRISWCRRWA